MKMAAKNNMLTFFKLKGFRTTYLSINDLKKRLEKVIPQTKKTVNFFEIVD
ncbi:MAG: hypothetical protein ABJB11_15920 [Ferruginibacter sp.]